MWATALDTSRARCRWVSGIEIVGPQRDQIEQAEKNPCGACDRRVRPLPLGLDAKVTPDFGESELDRPTTDKPAKDVERVGIKIGAQEDPRFELIGNVANQRRRVEQPGIETQAADHADAMPNGIEQFDGSETAIGHRDGLPLGKPVCHLQHDLPAPPSGLRTPTT